LNLCNKFHYNRKKFNKFIRTETDNQQWIDKITKFISIKFKYQISYSACNTLDEECLDVFLSSNLPKLKRLIL
jgi:hypothetical protein